MRLFKKYKSDYFIKGDTVLCIKDYDNISVGEIVEVSHLFTGGMPDYHGIRVDKFEEWRGENGGLCSRHSSIPCESGKLHFVPLRLLSDKDRFVFELSGRLPTGG